MATKSEKPRPTITKDLPNSLPGINIKTALKRMSGNRQLLVNLLLVFADNYARAAEDYPQNPGLMGTLISHDA